MEIFTNNKGHSMKKKYGNVKEAQTSKFPKKNNKF